MPGTLTQSLYQGTVISSRLPFVKGAKTITVMLALSPSDAANPAKAANVVPELLVNDHWREVDAQAWQGGKHLTLRFAVPSIAALPAAVRFSLDVPTLLSIGGSVALS